MQSVDIDIEHWRAVDGVKHNAQLRDSPYQLCALSQSRIICGYDS